MSLAHPKLVGASKALPYEVQSTSFMYGIKPPEMLVDNFLPAASLMGITAAPGVGKTWLMFELMRAASQGKPFLGHFNILNKHSCLFVGSDASVYDYARQWQRITRKDVEEWHPEWAKHTPRDNFEDPLEDNCRFLIQSGFLFEDLPSVHRLLKTISTFKWTQTDFHGVLPGENEDEVVVGATVERTGFDIIVFDTLSKMTRANQNDNTEMEEVFRNIRLVSEVTGATVILLHHNSKKSEFNSGEDWRGAVAQIGALDCWLQLSPGRGDKYAISAEMKKFRGITPEPFTYQMDVGREGAARLLIHSSSATGEQSFTDAFNEAIGHFIYNAYPNRVSITDISTAMWDKYAESVGNDVAKLRKKIKNRLRNDITYKGFKIIQLPSEGKTLPSQYVALVNTAGGNGEEVRPESIN